jgi:hypothetical protein
MNADQRSEKDLSAVDVDRRNAFYRSLNKLNRAALCCSGGGIRSATFCLGVIQALADYDVTGQAPPPRNTEELTARVSERASASLASEAKTAALQPPHRPIKPENSLLGRFHYLSTVSGGGYIGSWLSSWRARDDFSTVIRNLTSRPAGPDTEPPEISWLRAYSNYLTPRVGIASADTWTDMAVYIRNLVLNWLVIVPVVSLALLFLKLVVTGSVWIARSEDNDWLLVLIGLFGAACLIVAQAFTTSHRPTRRKIPGTPPAAADGNVTQTTFLFHDLSWAIVSAIAITSFFSSRFGIAWVACAGKNEVLGLTAAAGLLIYAAGWIAGRPLRPNFGDAIRWAASGLVYGALLGLGAYLFTLLKPYCNSCMLSDQRQLLNLLVPMIFGVPWVLVSQLVAEIIFVGLTSYEADSDSDREWLGRAAGWVATAAIAWALTAFLAFAAGHYVQTSMGWIGQMIGASTGGIAGIVTALLGESSRTPAKGANADQSGIATAYNIILAVAGPIFAAVLIIALSVGLDELLVGGSLIEALRIPTLSTGYIVLWLAIGFVIAAGIEWLASSYVNINRFSLHALYRNRLIRAYLGASRQERDPDRFTGFDIEDNDRVSDLWPPKSDSGTNSYSLFHVINIALNIVSTKRLAWQERKAESFTVTPLHCGSAYLGFRPSSEYGEYPGRGGISLGTAMAVSGAAVSPNMGYHSSPSIALLLTLFNVRLGWWLGNPGGHGEASYRTDGPSFAAKPLFEEAFGWTTDDRPYVYLSDGGHFENLGLYEMVRRRCRFIVVIDAGCDPMFAFEDLGNAVRKIYIDLGIRIHFEGLQALRDRPSEQAMEREAAGPSSSLREAIPYLAIGTIDYESADGSEHGCANGRVLYIKPAYHGTEGAGVRSYATAHPTFPHETTTDQWFTESQFESYRSLALDIVHDIVNHEVVLQAQPDKLTLHDVLATLDDTERP